MNQQVQFEQLQREFNLKDSDFYFLELIPLIEMIWADGMNQAGELKILYQFVIEHIANLDHLSKAPAISVEDANSFLDRFAHKKPDPRLLDGLMRLFVDKNSPKNQTILQYCMDIAAACITKYPYQFRERMMEGEKRVLENLFRELNIAADSPVNSVRS